MLSLIRNFVKIKIYSKSRTFLKLSMLGFLHIKAHFLIVLIPFVWLSYYH